MTDPPAGSICFVTSDFPPVVRNGGIGTHFWLMSRLLAAAGWRVHVLFCGPGDDPDVRRAMPASMAAEGIAFTALEDAAPPAWLDCPQYCGHPHWSALSQRAFEALRVLHDEHRFDLVEFQDWGGLGHCSVQAKRVGLALHDVRLAVKLHGTTQWQREGNLASRENPGDLKLEFCERYAFERADVQLSPSHYMFDYVRQAGWTVRDDALVSCPFPEGSGRVPAPETPICELVFFGRLERRKGLDLFLDALDELPEMPALFLGRDTDMDGRKASEIIAERLEGRPFRIEMDLDREAALDMLVAGGRMAVIPSQLETFGFTIAECVAHRIPFVAARAGGTPEVFADPDAQARWLFEPSKQGLIEAIARQLAAPVEVEAALRRAVQEQCDPARWNARVEHAYRGLLPAPGAQPWAVARERATVTVAVTHYEHGAYLPQALASLALQTRPPDEVIVIDDGSPSEDARRVFAEQEARFPQWQFVRQDNSGPGPARNVCLAKASGELFLAFDADNLATPTLIESYERALLRNPELSGVGCHTLAFTQDSDIDDLSWAFRYAPSGGPLLSALVENVYGDTCAMFRTRALRSVGGFETERWSPHEDLETFVKLRVNGHELDVVPDVLFHYRTGVGGRFQVLTQDPRTTFRHRRKLIEEFYLGASLTRQEQIELWETLIGLAELAYTGVAAAIAWHVSELERASEWHAAEMGRADEFRLEQVGEMADWHAAEMGRADEFRIEQVGEMTDWHTAEMERADEFRLRQVGEMTAWHEHVMSSAAAWHAGQRDELDAFRRGQIDELRKRLGELEPPESHVPARDRVGEIAPTLSYVPTRYRVADLAMQALRRVPGVPALARTLVPPTRHHLGRLSARRRR